MIFKFFNDKLRELGELETERLILRSFREEDAMDMYEYAGDKDVTSKLTWTVHSNVESCRAYIKHVSSKEPNNYAIVLKDYNKVIGAIDLRLIPEDNKGSFGYVVAKKHWNKGYATEALEKIMEVAFDEIGLNKLESCYFANNKSSGAVMEKCGLNYEGTRIESQLVKGEYIDCISYGLTKSEYNKKKNK